MTILFYLFSTHFTSHSSQNKLKTLWLLEEEKKVSTYSGRNYLIARKINRMKSQKKTFKNAFQEFLFELKSFIYSVLTKFFCSSVSILSSRKLNEIKKAFKASSFMLIKEKEKKLSPSIGYYKQLHSNVISALVPFSARAIAIKLKK